MKSHGQKHKVKTPQKNFGPMSALYFDFFVSTHFLYQVERNYTVLPKECFPKKMNSVNSFSYLSNNILNLIFI